MFLLGAGWYGQKERIQIFLLRYMTRSRRHKQNLAEMQKYEIV